MLTLLATVKLDRFHVSKPILSKCTVCEKTTEKVSFYNIASEASYVYILNGQKLFKIGKSVQFGEFF